MIFAYIFSVCFFSHCMCKKPACRNKPYHWFTNNTPKHSRVNDCWNTNTKPYEHGFINNEFPVSSNITFFLDPFCRSMDFTINYIIQKEVSPSSQKKWIYIFPARIVIFGVFPNSSFIEKHLKELFIISSVIIEYAIYKNN